MKAPLPSVSSRQLRWLSQAVHPEGDYFLTGGRKGELCLWDMPTARRPDETEAQKGRKVHRSVGGATNAFAARGDR
jgi:hypothetical protein